MQTNQKILESFGRLLINDVFDAGLGLTNNDLDAFKNTDGYKELFRNTDSIGKMEFDRIIYDILDGALFNFLRIFEEHEDFKLIYQENGKQINLVEISEMLKAEPIIEGGWIERFSKYSEKNKK